MEETPREPTTAQEKGIFKTHPLTGVFCRDASPSLVADFNGDIPAPSSANGELTPCNEPLGTQTGRSRYILFISSSPFIDLVHCGYPQNASLSRGSLVPCLFQSPSGPQGYQFVNFQGGILVGTSEMLPFPAVHGGFLLPADSSCPF